MARPIKFMTTTTNPQSYHRLIAAHCCYVMGRWYGQRNAAEVYTVPMFFHHLDLRLATGALKTSPIPCLYDSTHQMSLEKRRKLLSICCAQRILVCPTYPAHKNSVLKSSPSWLLIENKPRVVRQGQTGSLPSGILHDETVLLQKHAPLLPESLDRQWDSSFSSLISEVSLQRS